MSKAILNIETATDAAYARSSYTPTGWTACIQYLLSQKLTEQQIIDFMLSKHMRWAGDINIRQQEHGAFNVDTLKDYIKHYPKSLKDYIKHYPKSLSENLSS